MGKTKTERVRILVSLGGVDDHGEYSYGGGEHELPADRAAQLVKAGHAERVGAAPRKKAAASASTPKAAPRKRRSRRKAS